MTDLLQVYSEKTIESYDEQTLKECETVAALAMEGFIPKEKLPGLHFVLGDEKAGLVMEAMEGDDDQ